jgi:integrase
MASPILRDDIWSLVWYWRGKKKFRSTKIRHDGKFDKKTGEPILPAAVKRELLKLEVELERGSSPQNYTVADLLDKVENEYQVNGYDSLASLKSRIRHLKDFFGNLRAERVAETDYIDYAAARQRTSGAANNTINRELEMLVKALRLGKLTPPALKKLKAPPPRQGFFDDAKMQSLVRHLPEYLRAPALFGYHTGWRREEVFGLERKDVDFETGEIRLHDSKNDTPRVFPMDVVPGLRALLEATVASADRIRQSASHGQAVAIAPSPYIFARFRKPQREFRRITEFRKAWETACRKAGCPGMLLHDFRRSAARNLELAGWSRSLIMSWMGHETESMFHRYRIVSASDREIVARRIAEMKSAAHR